MPASLDLTRRLSLLRIDEPTGRTLASFSGLAATALPDLTVHLHDDLRRFPSDARPALLELADGTRLRHWLLGFSGPFDGDDAASVRRMSERRAAAGNGVHHYIEACAFAQLGRVNDSAAPIRDTWLASTRDRGPHAVTRIPLAPHWIAGALNLRGRIVTAIDVRKRLGVASAGRPETDMAIVVERGGDAYALIVDEVGEVVRSSRPDAAAGQAAPNCLT